MEQEIGHILRCLGCMECYPATMTQERELADGKIIECALCASQCILVFKRSGAHGKI